MPYNWNGDYIPSKANKSTDILGMKEIGGVGQLIYHPFRFKKYVLQNDNADDYCACPLCDSKNKPTFPNDDSVSGKGLLVSLCNLAKQINDFNSKTPYDKLIVKWCEENMHPYSLDFIYTELVEEGFDINGFDAEVVAHDGVFCIETFKEDLGRLYTTVLYYEALEGVCLAEENAAYNLYSEGKYFEGLPFFEKYKVSHKIPDIDVSSANGDLLSEMKLYSQYEKEHPTPKPPEGEFAEEPYDDYEYLRSLLIERIPDFRMRLKVNPKSNRLEFSADVNSVFDIAWYTLARILAEDPAPEDKGSEEERPEGIMICCKCCGDFLIRRNSRQEYCNKKECQDARNAQNQRNFRKKKRIEKAQIEKKTKQKRKTDS